MESSRYSGTSTLFMFFHHAEYALMLLSFEPLVPSYQHTLNTVCLLYALGRAEEIAGPVGVAYLSEIWLVDLLVHLLAEMIIAPTLIALLVRPLMINRGPAIPDRAPRSHWMIQSPSFTLL